MRILLILLILMLFGQFLVSIYITDTVNARSPRVERLKQQLQTVIDANDKLRIEILHYESYHYIEQEAEKLGFSHTNELYILPTLDK